MFGAGRPVAVEAGILPLRPIDKMLVCHKRLNVEDNHNSYGRQIANHDFSTHHGDITIGLHGLAPSG